MRSIQLTLAGIVLTTLSLVIEILRTGFLSWLTPLLVLTIVVMLLALRRSQWLVAQIAKWKTIDVSETTIAEFFRDATENEKEVDTAIGAISEIGQEGFSARISSLKNDHIRTSLLSTHEKISALRRNEREKNWITVGVAAITGLKQKTSDISEYALQVITSAVKYVNANQGGFYMFRQEGAQGFFELVASYAYGKKKYVDQKIYAGEGLVGQVYYDREVILLTEVPADYVKITSGLGQALPRCICILPLLSEGEIYGALEIASFEKLQPFEIEYLRKVGESVGYNLKAIDGHRKTELLLTESQEMAQEVKSQEEELRQNMEELKATQEQMQRKQDEMNAVLSELSVIELDTHGVIREANAVFLGITGYENEDLKNKPYVELIPKPGNDRMQYEMMWKSLMQGKTFSGEFRILNSDRQEVWMVGNFTPLVNEHGIPYKVMVVTLFNTQDKEKLIELQEVMAALKNCFPMVEINPDLTFKSANELFLLELGIKRMELKKLKLQETFQNGSSFQVENYLRGSAVEANNLDISLQCKNGEIRPFVGTLAKINSNDQLKRGILILRKRASK